MIINKGKCRFHKSDEDISAKRKIIELSASTFDTLYTKFIFDNTFYQPMDPLCRPVGFIPQGFWVAWILNPAFATITPFSATKAWSS